MAITKPESVVGERGGGEEGSACEREEEEIARESILFVFVLGVVVFVLVVAKAAGMSMVGLRGRGCSSRRWAALPNTAWLILPRAVSCPSTLPLTPPPLPLPPPMLTRETVLSRLPVFVGEGSEGVVGSTVAVVLGFVGGEEVGEGERGRDGGGEEEEAVIVVVRGVVVGVGVVVAAFIPSCTICPWLLRRCRSLCSRAARTRARRAAVSEKSSVLYVYI